MRPGTRVMIYPRRQDGGRVICAAVGEVVEHAAGGDVVVDLGGPRGRLWIPPDKLAAVAAQ